MGLIIALVCVSIFSAIGIAQGENPFAAIAHRLDRVIEKLTVIANQTAKTSAAISLKCSWTSNMSVQPDYVGHCDPQPCPQGFQNAATDDVKTNWIPNTAWGYTERWCVK